MCQCLLHCQPFLCVQEFDGAARGNPGPAGAGAALFDDSRGMQVVVNLSCNIALHATATAAGQICCMKAHTLRITGW